MLRAPLTRPVGATTTARINLELGPWLSVPVWTFKATEEAKVPPMRLWSDGAPADDPNATHVVTRETSLKLPAENVKDDMVPEVPVDERMQGALRHHARSKFAPGLLTLCCVVLCCAAAHRYGKDFVPMNKIEQSALKARTPRARTHRARAQTQRRTPCSGPLTRLAAASSRAQFKAMSAFKPEEELKGMQLLGFTPAKNLPPTLFLKSADYVLPVPRKTHPSGNWASGGTDAETAARCAARAAAAQRCGCCAERAHTCVRLRLRCRAQLCGGAVCAGDGADGQRVRGARALHSARACPPACRAVPCPCSHASVHSTSASCPPPVPSRRAATCVWARCRPC